MATRAEIERLERAAATAWPADRLTDIDGWIVRESGGGSRRANSVLPLSFQGRDVDRAINTVEAHYFNRGLKSYFQVSQIAVPNDLDARLAARGYALEEPTLLMAKALSASAMPSSVDMLQTPNTDWLDIYGAELTADRRATVPTILARVPVPRAYFLARSGNQPAATALGVVVDRVAVVECVATAAAARRTSHKGPISR